MHHWLAPAPSPCQVSVYTGRGEPGRASLIVQRPIWERVAGGLAGSRPGTQWGLNAYLQRMDRYYSIDAHLKWSTLAPEPRSAYRRRGNLYFTCEGDEKLRPVVLDWLGEDQMMASADMPHMEARETSPQEIAERGDLSDVHAQDPEAERPALLPRVAVR